MDIQSSTVKKITITNIPNLDPISVYLEDFGKGRGNLIITCANESWTYYWGSMGEHNLSQFITTCDNHYLSKKLNPVVKADIDDCDGLEKHAQKHIMELRRNNDISKDDARKLYDECYKLFDYKDTDSAGYSEIMYNIFGDEWWDCLPIKPNPEYMYFCRILDIVKEALNYKDKK